jgi:hypothetical protein
LFKGSFNYGNLNFPSNISIAAAFITVLFPALID